MTMDLTSIKNRISAMYYNYGLFCSTHPLQMLLFTAAASIIICYPLTNTSFLGNTPAEFKTPKQPYVIPKDTPSPSSPYWYKGKPIGYIQQILVKSTIAPWNKDQVRAVDSFRAPVYQAFKIAKIIREFRFSRALNGSNATEVTLEDLCLHVPEPQVHRRGKHVLPEYSCLYLSPASLWNNDNALFEGDSDFMGKLLGPSYSTSFEAAPTLQEVAFGVPWLESGIRRYFMRHRQRVVYYAATVIFKTYDAEYIAALQKKLLDMFPLSSLNEMPGLDDDSERDYLSHVSYRQSDTNYFSEYLPLIVAYLVLFFYIFFSVQKIEMVKSKWGLAFSALVTVVISLLMSLSICTTFGVTPSSNTCDIFPYLVVVIGLENMLILTRSVVSTPYELEVKVRVAQGLQKESWSITKHLLTELIILLVGFVTFVPDIQEFCLFAVVGLLVDYFIQMVFFVTVLSIDIRRLELSDLNRARREPHSKSSDGKYVSACPFMAEVRSPASGNSHQRSASSSSFFTASFFNIPKRIRVMNFFAQFRVLQNGIMICTIIWYFLFMYNYGLFGVIGAMVYSRGTPSLYPDPDVLARALPQARDFINRHRTLWPSIQSALHADNIASNWKRLSFMHWPSLFGFYDISIVGRYVSFLPTMKLSILVPPDEARSLHHEREDDYEDIYVVEGAASSFDSGSPDMSELHSNLTMMMTAMKLDRLLKWDDWTLVEGGAYLITAAGIVFGLGYVMKLLYSCMCGRNYHRWRARWRLRRSGHHSKYDRFPTDIQPMLMQGHLQPIECLAVDHWYAASSCLAGEIRVWDTLTGDLISNMPRHRHRLRKNVSDECKLRGTPKEGRAAILPAPSAPRTLCNVDFTPYIDLNFNRSSTVQRSFSEWLNEIALENGVDLISPGSVKQNASTGSVSSRDTPCSSHPENPHPTSQSLMTIGDMPPSPDFSSRNNSASSFVGFEDTSSSLLFDSSALSCGGVDSEPIFCGVWSLDMYDGLVAAGCSDGSVELWDAISGTLKCIYCDKKNNGATVLKFVGSRLLVGRTNGALDCLSIVQSGTSPAKPACERMRRRDSFKSDLRCWSDDDVEYHLMFSVRLHQSAIHIIQMAGDSVITAAQSPVLRITRLDSHSHSPGSSSHRIHTLSGGHEGSITALRVLTPTSCETVSGAIDGSVCLWNHVNGSIVHRLANGDDTMAVLEIAHSSRYIVASSSDALLRVWDRSGRLLHRIVATSDGVGFARSIAYLGHSVLVAGGVGQVHLIDLAAGDVVLDVPLTASTAEGDYVRTVRVIQRNTMVCCAGSQLQAFTFPRAIDKSD